MILAIGDLGFDIKISMNLSSSQITDNIFAYLSTYINDNKIPPPRLLELEVIESVLVDDLGTG